MPFSADGVGVELTWDTLGLRATGSHTVLLDNVFVPDAAVSGRSEAHTFQLLGEMMNPHTTAADVVAAAFLDFGNLHFPNTDEYGSRTLSRKTVATNALIDTVRLAIEVTGGVGYTRSSDIERLYRDVHGSLFHPLPRAKQTQLTGRVALGLSPVP